MAHSERTSEVGLTEIATILNCSRQSAWVYARCGDIKGSRFVANRLWVAPRSAVERFKQEREQASVQPPIAA